MIRERLARRTGGAAILPLLLLFALNLVDEFDQVAFGVLAPEIRDAFGLSDAAFTAIVTVSGALVILLIVPVGYLADRYSRVRMTAGAALLWGTMSVMTGLAPALAVLVLARFGAGLGRVMNEPVHASLLADYYEPEHHGKVFSLHRMGNPLGLLLVLVAGLLAQLFGWRATFVLLALPTLLLVLLVTRLREPLRGQSIDLGLAAEADKADKVPFGEAFRTLAAIGSLKRAWAAAFLLGAAVLPITTFFSFFYEQVYGVTNPGPWGRAGIIAVYAAGAVLGLLLAGRLATDAIAAGRTDRLALLGGAALAATGLSLLAMAVSPWLGLSIAWTLAVGVAGGGFQGYNLPLIAIVAPPRLRSQAFGYFGFWFAVGAILIAGVVSRVGENQGYRWGITVLSLLVLVAGVVYASARRFVARDVDQAAQTLQTAAALHAEAEASGERALLVCKGVEVAYDQVQVLFGIDLEIRRGECVALLGTNGAGKSTLLGAVSGVVDPIGGAIFFDGRDVTHADGAQTAALGITQVPGGRAVFPTLTVTEHLRAAGWLYRDDPGYLRAATAEVLDIFPRLRERSEQLAGNLSGGEQQMLGLAMAFIAQPKLLMIDELSLGLAPAVVEQLLGIVRRIQERGTAVVLVEQSVNVALSIAERAYFLEKGEVRFSGPTAQLLERGDLLRSVFLEGAAAVDVAVVEQPRDDDPTVELPQLDLEHPALMVVRELSKNFGGVRAVDGVSFTLHEREILGIIGPNGAGKTTVFDCISGFAVPDSGLVALGGEDLTRLTPDQRAWAGLGRSFQDARLAPSLTVAENLALALERHLAVRDHVAACLNLPGAVRQEEDVAWTVADLVELCGLEAFRDKFVRELSTGSRRIVDLAMCIAHDPQVLLLDEPSSGIAQRETEALGPLLQRIQAETGCALLVIEHDMPLITSIAHRLVALDLGRVVTSGTPRQVVRDPRVVESYLGGDPSAVQRSGALSGGTVS